MPIQVSWGDEQHTYIYIRVEGSWEWQDYHACISRANQLINTVEHEVSVITHLTDAQAQILPPNAFSQWRKVIHNNPDHVRVVIIVPGRPIVQVFIDTVYRIFGRFFTFKFRMASTLEEAQNISREMLDAPASSSLSA